MSRDWLFMRGTVAALAVVMSGCGSVRPSTTTMHIEPQPAVMAVGDVIKFTADIAGRFLSDVAWSVVGGSATLNGSTLTARTPGQITLKATGAGVSTSVTIDIVPNVAGTWFGIMHQPTCVRLSGKGPTYCGKSANGWNSELTITISQSGSSLTSIEGGLDGTLQTKAALVGHIESNGRLAIPDLAMFLKDEEGTWSLLQCDVSVREIDGKQTLSGTALYDQQFVSDLFGPQHYSNQNSFVLRRQ